LADPAKPEDGNHPAMLIHKPLLQRYKLAVTAIQRRDSDCLAPIDDRVGRSWPCRISWRRTGRLFSFVVGPLDTCYRRSALEREHAGEPQLIERGERMWPIVRDLLPQRERFRTLVAGCKGVAAEEDGDQALEH